MEHISTQCHKMLIFIQVFNFDFLHLYIQISQLFAYVLADKLSSYQRIQIKVMFENKEHYPRLR
jgi:hypothetical protein